MFLLGKQAFSLFALFSNTKGAFSKYVVTLLLCKLPPQLMSFRIQVVSQASHSDKDFLQLTCQMLRFKSWARESEKKKLHKNQYFGLVKENVYIQIKIFVR